MTAPRPHVLIAGCGYVGQRLAARLRERFEVTALVRSNDSAAALERQGLKSIVIDLDRVRAGASIPERLDQEAIVYLAPPPGQGESDLRLDRFLHLAFVPPKTFVYMSTTGVYGDADGGFVDESTPVRPMTDRARRRVSAEEMTRVWCHERRVRRVVLRVPGIYGPGRLPLERLKKSEPVVRIEDAGISNRIHVDDLVMACQAGIDNQEARGVYNVTDGNSISSTEFIDLVARLTGLPPPPRVSMEEAQLTFSPERLSFLNESRRVGNDRMLKHLGVKLRYTDIEAGVRASLPGGA
ncbi:SDR family oxidoreductase [Steroidobacter sp.]|uniref:SDR family oxidoreductase n=1 Tax=Steroidobacter sp. TaxID=1978227 RepID=UPI001A41B0BD|nr:SDR family oxidoreductase [Steroidobacter sp.]MBL8264772.1 SDR family oxidoreductase [Steroidobacter sp.]